MRWMNLQNLKLENPVVNEADLTKTQPLTNQEIKDFELAQLISLALERI